MCWYSSARNGAEGSENVREANFYALGPLNLWTRDLLRMQRSSREKPGRGFSAPGVASPRGRPTPGDCQPPHAGYNPQVGGALD
jgi:hypothetical protein